MIRCLVLEAVLSATTLSLPLIESIQPVSLPLFLFLYSNLSPLAVKPWFLFGVMKSLNQTTPLNLKTLSQRVSNLVFCYNHLGSLKKRSNIWVSSWRFWGNGSGLCPEHKGYWRLLGDSNVQHSWEAGLYQAWAAARSPGQDHLTPCDQILFPGVGDTNTHTHKMCQFRHTAKGNIQLHHNFHNTASHMHLYPLDPCFCTSFTPGPWKGMCVGVIVWCYVSDYLY